MSKLTIALPRLRPVTNSRAIRLAIKAMRAARQRVAVNAPTVTR